MANVNLENDGRELMDTEDDKVLLGTVDHANDCNRNTCKDFLGTVHVDNASTVTDNDMFWHTLEIHGRHGKSPMEPQKSNFEKEKKGKKKEESNKQRMEMVH